MKTVNITLISTNGGGEFYPSNYIYTVDEKISIKDIELAIQKAKKEIDDYYDDDIMHYLVEKFGGSFTAPPGFCPDVEMLI